MLTRHTGYFETEFVALAFIPGTPYAVLLCDVVYVDAAGRRHVARRGMVTDGMSVPRFFWRVVGAPFRNGYLLACIIHDHYCYKAATVPPGPGRDKLRLAGDKLFGEMCGVLGAGKARQATLVKAVRIGASMTEGHPAAPDYEHEPVQHMSALGVDPCVVNAALLACIVRS